MEPLPVGLIDREASDGASMSSSAVGPLLRPCVQEALRSLLWYEDFGETDRTPCEEDIRPECPGMIVLLCLSCYFCIGSSRAARNLAAFEKAFPRIESGASGLATVDLASLPSVRSTRPHFRYVSLYLLVSLFFHFRDSTFLSFRSSAVLKNDDELHLSVPL